MSTKILWLTIPWLSVSCGLPALSAEDCPSPSFQLFTPAFSGLGPNSVEKVAKTFAGGIFGNQDPLAVHRANPDAKVYRYQLGPYVEIRHVPKELVPPGHPFFAEAGTAPLKLAASAIARQGPDGPNPGLCTWPRQFPPYVLTVPDDPAWLTYLETLVSSRVANYDGVFLDSMGTVPVATNYLLAKPVRPATGKPYSPGEWLTAEIVMAGRVKKTLRPGQAIIVQGLFNGEHYFSSDNLRPLLAHCDGAMAEMIYRGPRTRADHFPSPRSWLNDVQMIADVEAQGKGGYYWTKAWVPLAEPQRRQWLRFVLCSHLLAAGAHSYFNFDSFNEPLLPAGRGNNADPCEYHSEYDKAFRLGSAADRAMSAIDHSGAYGRRWQHGRVYVNPTATSVVLKVSVSGDDFDGNRIVGAIALPPHSGQIVLGRQ